jgi:hypothetical protein
MTQSHGPETGDGPWGKGIAVRVLPVWAFGPVAARRDDQQADAGGVTIPASGHENSFSRQDAVYCPDPAWCLQYEVTKGP